MDIQERVPVHVHTNRQETSDSPVSCSHGVLTVHRHCPTLLGSGWLKWRELAPPLLADVIIPSLYLPGELGDRCSLVFGGPVQFTDVVAEFGWVILHGSTSAAFLTSELQDGEDASKFTDHPVLKPEDPEDSQYLHQHAGYHITVNSVAGAFIHTINRQNQGFL